MAATIDLECPNCGRTGHVPKEKVETRLVCKKCHVVFHITSDGRAMLGEPASREAATAAKAEKIRKEVKKAAEAPAPRKIQQREEPESALEALAAKIPMKYVVPGVLGFLVLYGAFTIYKNWPVDDLVFKAEDAAQATLDDDASKLKEMCSSGGGDAIDEWLPQIKKRIDAEKKNAVNKEVEQSVLVETEDTKSKRGESVAYVQPVSVAPKARRNPALEIYYVWVLQKGLWKLDAEATLDAIDGFGDSPADSPPPSQ